jgi:hypothetical protein
MLTYYEDGSQAIKFDEQLTNYINSKIESEVEARMKDLKIPVSTYDPNERLTRKEVCNIYKITYPTLHHEMQKGLSYEKLGKKNPIQAICSRRLV